LQTFVDSTSSKVKDATLMGLYAGIIMMVGATLTEYLSVMNMLKLVKRQLLLLTSPTSRAVGRRCGNPPGFATVVDTRQN
jgi:hypothetical protein